MPKPSTTRSIGALYRDPIVPGQEVDPILFFDPPSGLDTKHPIDKMGLQYSPDMFNYRIADTDWLTCRPGTVELGTDSVNQIVAVVVVSLANSVELVVRWTTVGVQWYDGTMWNNLTGPALALTTDDNVSATVWNNGLQFTDGKTGQYLINFNDFTYALIATAPIARHITTLAGRIIASFILDPATGIYQTRIQWCVKNDNTDWSGLGSGFEDLLSSPGGVVDQQLCVVPINDTDALIVRSGSIWRMQSTQYFDSPFIFQFLFSEMKFDSWRGVTAIPGGIAALGRDDIYIITTGGPQPIGDMVRKIIFTRANKLEDCQLAWDDLTREIVIHLPKRMADGYSNVFRYSIDTPRWSRDIYPGVIKSFVHASQLRGTPIDALVGTIDELTGSIDDLGVDGFDWGLVFGFIGTHSFVSRESPDATSDAIGGSGTSLITMQAVTGYVNPATAFKYVQLLQAGLLYEVPVTTTMLIEYSDNGGVTWSTYSTLTLAASSGPVPARGVKTIERKRIQLRFTAVGYGLNVRTFAAKVQEGTEVLL